MSVLRVDLLVHYREADQAWAEWVARQLTDAGYSVELDVRHWTPGAGFQAVMRSALERCDRAVMLFSAAYFDRLLFTAEEWENSELRVPSMSAQLVPVRVEEVPAAQVPAILRPLIPRDLFGIPEEQAKRVLLQAVAATGSRRPSPEPVWPGGGTSGSMGRLGRFAAQRSAPASPSVASGRIFVSYRREDTAYPSGWLFDKLAQHFGPDQIFKDIDSIQLGDDFVAVITAAVGGCEVLLALIGRQWLTISGEDGRRRLDNPSDFVRLEIETAITRNIRIIPILVEGARMPHAGELPSSLAELARRQALELSPSRFTSDTSRLLRVLDQILTAY